MVERSKRIGLVMVPKSTKRQVIGMRIKRTAQIMDSNLEDKRLKIMSLINH